ncbi:MAG: CCA tRNA nucleotidyltransferase [Thermoplasmata archaeon]|nr:CCA tRNA nucleotidyltransferase [Thermoplasmata archaeon]
MNVDAEVLARVKPTKQQDKKVAAAVEALTKKVLSEAKAHSVLIEPMLVGSVAKGTNMKDPDIDLFMLFPESTSLERLKEVGLDIGRKILGGREHYAQHPYVRGEFAGFEVDLVPAYKIRDTRCKMSAVDRTPFHTEFVKRSLDADQLDEVRLLKRFMKGIGCYGAEAKVQGFSGYLCELLVIRFGSFRDVLKAASGWKVGEALELPEHPGSEFPEPLTFVDPVDPTRNVASAIAVESLLRFVHASREYLAGGDIRFFFPNPPEVWDTDTLQAMAGERLGNIIAVTFPKLDLIDDVSYPQLRKSLSSVAALLGRHDFEVEKTTVHVDGESHLLVELASMSLPKERKHRGPPVNSENSSEFLAKWQTLGVSKPYVEDGRWFVMVRREHVRGDGLVRSGLKALTLGKDVRKAGEVEVHSGEQLLDGRHLAALTHHFDERMPWQR